MPKINPDSLRNTIQKLQRQLMAIEERQQSVRAEAVKFLVEAQKRLGLTLADLASGEGKSRGRKVGRLAKRKKPASLTMAKAKKKGRTAKDLKKARKVAPKYRSPSGETWTGRGKPPRWLAALLAEGRTREEFLISASNS